MQLKFDGILKSEKAWQNKTWNIMRKNKIVKTHEIMNIFKIHKYFWEIKFYQKNIKFKIAKTRENIKGKYFREIPSADLVGLLPVREWRSGMISFFRGEGDEHNLEFISERTIQHWLYFQRASCLCIFCLLCDSLRFPLSRVPELPRSIRPLN